MDRDGRETPWTVIGTTGRLIARNASYPLASAAPGASRSRQKIRTRVALVTAPSHEKRPGARRPCARRREASCNAH
eukprot:5875851-Prymnesium_polylepis.1